MTREEKLRSKIVKYIDDFDRIFKKRYAEEVKFYIELELNKEIDQFYDDYSPTSYKRTYNLYNAVKTFVLSKGDEFYVGIYIGSEYMKKWYSDPVDYVYVGAIKKGIHGVSAIHVTQPSPLRRMMKVIKDLDLSKIRWESMQYAANQLGLDLKKPK